MSLPDESVIGNVSGGGGDLGELKRVDSVYVAPSAEQVLTSLINLFFELISTTFVYHLSVPRLYTSSLFVCIKQQILREDAEAKGRKSSVEGLHQIPLKVTTQAPSAATTTRRTLPTEPCLKD
jgi:hypothetical protein